MTQVALIAPSGRDREQLTKRLAEAAYQVHHEGEAATGEPCVDAIVVHAFHRNVDYWLGRARELDVPSVLVCARSANAPHPKPGHSEPACSEHVRGMRADAYVWRDSRITEAVRYVLGEARDLRSAGPTRLVFLGHGGEDYTRSRAPSVGESFDLAAHGDELWIGRPSQPKVTIPFTTSVARLHARVFQKQGETFIADYASTNGTYVDGTRIPDGPGDCTAISPGQEIAIARFLRLRLDGS